MIIHHNRFLVCPGASLPTYIQAVSSQCHLRWQEYQQHRPLRRTVPWSLRIFKKSLALPLMTSECPRSIQKGGATPLLLPQLSYPQEAWQTDVSYTGIPPSSRRWSWFPDNCALLTMKWSTPITLYEDVPSEKVTGWRGVTEQCCDRNQFVPGPVFFWLSLLSDADVEQMLLKAFEQVTP